MKTRLSILMLASLVGMGMLLILMQPTGTAAAKVREMPIPALRNNDGTLNWGAGVQGTIDLDGWGVAIDPVRGPVVSPQKDSGLGSQWQPIPNDGLNGPVLAIAALGNDLYVGGKFTSTKDGAVSGLNRIAKFSNGVWSALPNDGLDGFAVNAFAVVGNDLYVGGEFAATMDGAVDNLGSIAKFSNGQWSALPNEGVSGHVKTIEVKDNELYVGGFFSTTGDFTILLYHIAKFSGGVWSAMPNEGLNHGVSALKWYRNDLYAGGAFTKTRDGKVEGIRHFARLRNGNEWVAVDGDGLDDDVLAFAILNNRLIVGGRFNKTYDGSKALNNIALYDGSSFLRIANDGLNARVESLLVNDGILFVGGGFARTFDSAVENLNYIAIYRNNAWFALPNDGVNLIVDALAVRGGSLFVGGHLTGTYDRKVENTWRFAEMNLGANVKLRQTVTQGNSPAEFRVGLTATNRGPNNAAGVGVEYPEPVGYEITAANPGQGDCNVKQKKVVCAIGTMTAKQDVNIEIVLRSNGSNPVVTPCGEVSATTYDPNPQNQKACVRIPPQ